MLALTHDADDEAATITSRRARRDFEPAKFSVFAEEPVVEHAAAAGYRAQGAGFRRTRQIEAVPGFRKPGGAATLPELIKFIIDRTGYIKSLEAEGTPEAFLAD